MICSTLSLGVRLWVKARFSYSRKKTSSVSPDWSPKNGALLERGAGIAAGPVVVAPDILRREMCVSFVAFVVGMMDGSIWCEGRERWEEETCGSSESASSTEERRRVDEDGLFSDGD